MNVFHELDLPEIIYTISLFRRYFYDPILAGKVVRLIYRGQLLRDDSRSLSSYGIQDQCVLHCNVSTVPYAQPTSNARSMGLFWKLSNFWNVEHYCAPSTHFF